MRINDACNTIARMRHPKYLLFYDLRDSQVLSWCTSSIIYSNGLFFMILMNVLMEFLFNFLKIFLVLYSWPRSWLLIPREIVTFLYLFCALIASRWFDILVIYYLLLLWKTKKDNTLIEGYCILNDVSCERESISRVFLVVFINSCDLSLWLY